jgi:hypothetical protein
VNDDYLWDRTGEPDPELVRLETLLGRYRHEQPLRVAVHKRRWGWLAAAAAAVILFGAGFGIYRFYWPSGDPWVIAGVTGTARIDGRPVHLQDRLAVGTTLVTDPGSKVIVRIARVGELAVAPGTELELIATSARRHRIALRRGTVDARVWAPPFVFAIDTPAGLASDIGCAFTLRYADQGGLLRVNSGWVDFDGDLRSSLVPGGAMSELNRSHGPGTPYWNDAPPALRAALRDFDATGNTVALQRVLAAARPRDAMTVEHILERARREHRGMLFDRLGQLAPPPRGVTREGVVEGNDAMIAAWRKHLGLGSAKKWWLQWRDALPD